MVLAGTSSLLVCTKTPGQAVSRSEVSGVSAIPLRADPSQAAHSLNLLQSSSDCSMRGRGDSDGTKGTHYGKETLIEVHSCRNVALPLALHLLFL